MFVHSIGEFFLLYGSFEQKYGIEGKRTRTKMLNLKKDYQRYLKPYTERGTMRKDPLPYAVRKILTHAGHNPNTPDKKGDDLRTSVDLLRQWTGKTEKTGS